MTIATITLTDRDNGQLDIEGKVDNQNAINEPPTAVLVVLTYMVANFDKVCADASEWFETRTLTEEDESPVVDLPAAESPAVEPQ